MRLSIRRNQSELTDRKGRSEGVVFEFGCQLVLDQDEHAVIEKYRLWGYPLAMHRMSEIRGLSQDDMHMSPERLASGWNFQTRFASDAHQVEDTIKEGCSDFKNVMKMLVAYGGEEEITFD
jgi:hypothetical protein